ncbi:MAG: hypothetical protein ACP5SH_24875 [Syntrophobacteraceae bacterium]
MLHTLWAIVKDGKIELLDRADIPDGTRVLVTLLPDDFWMLASESSLGAVWNNKEDDVYEQLLKE